MQPSQFGNIWEIFTNVKLFHTKALHSLPCRFLRTASREPWHCHGEPIYGRVSFWKRSQSSRRTLSSESHETAGTRSCHSDDFATTFSQFFRLRAMRYGSTGYHEGVLLFFRLCLNDYKLNLWLFEFRRFWLPVRVTRLTGMVALNSTSISHRTILSHPCKCIWPQPAGTRFVSILTFTTTGKFASPCSTLGTVDRKRNGIHTHQVSFKSLCLSNRWFLFRSRTSTSLAMRDHVEPLQEIRIRVTMTSISDRLPSSGLC